MVGGHKCRRFKGSEDAKVQYREGVMVGGHKCGRFKGSEDVIGPIVGTYEGLLRLC